jgi:hypothetical protein
MHHMEIRTDGRLQASIPNLLRDLAAGFQQQMFFWGRDAIHSEGNLFVRSGFHKRHSGGLQGTSCYSLPWQDGSIELHGSHAGWFAKSGGFLYVRPLRRCVRWLDGTPPIPGTWPSEQYQSASDDALYKLAMPFIDWWLNHERIVSQLAGLRYRQECFRLFKKLPKTRGWLAPEDAIRWITALRDEPANLSRAARFAPSTRRSYP